VNDLPRAQITVWFTPLCTVLAAQIRSWQTTSWQFACGNEDKDEEEQAYLKQLHATNRFVHLQRHQPWI